MAAIQACRLVIAVHALCLSTLPVCAQTIYRSTSADGHTTFSDIPNAQAIRAEPRSGQAAMPQYTMLPSGLRNIVDRFPVTLYTTHDCMPCDSARQLLRGRGIPFTEKTIESPEDITAFNRLSGANTLPLLSLGTQQVKGYSETSWHQYLSAAGYPENSTLPSNFRYPTPTPLVHVKTAPTPVPQENTSDAMAPLPMAPAPANPAGIRF